MTTLVDSHQILLAMFSGTSPVSDSVPTMANPPEAHREIEYHLRQAFLTAESETTKFHVRKVASLLEQSTGVEGLLE